MIVRDEEAVLERALRSVAGVVDAVCVVDTGSTDGTLALAARLGAHVARAPWSDDFAAARNRSLELARETVGAAGHVLVLDADEELVHGPGGPPETRAAIDAFRAEHPGSVGRVLLENTDAAGDTSRLRLSRILPNDGRHAFAGRVHEQIEREGSAGAETHRADVDVLVHHHGYGTDELVRKDKLARNGRLLARALADEPADGYLWYQLGRTRALAGDAGGALGPFEEALARCPADAPWLAPLVEQCAYALRALGRSDEALGVLEPLAERFGSRPDTVFLLALLALDLGRLEEAEAGFRRCLTLGRGSAGPAESCPSAAREAPAFNLGVMRECVGLPDEAADWYRRALELRPGHPPSLAGLARLGPAADPVAPPVDPVSSAPSPDARA